jgi:hypothetical protein
MSLKSWTFFHNAFLGGYTEVEQKSGDIWVPVSNRGCGYFPLSLEFM